MQNANKNKQQSLERKNPVDAWPGSLMFFFRTTGLLRGLCSTLDVQQKYLSIMAAKAERALKLRFPDVVAYPPPLLYASHSDATVPAVDAKYINAALKGCRRRNVQ